MKKVVTYIAMIAISISLIGCSSSSQIDQKLINDLQYIIDNTKNTNNIVIKNDGSSGGNNGTLTW